MMELPPWRSRRRSRSEYLKGARSDFKECSSWRTGSAKTQAREEDIDENVKRARGDIVPAAHEVSDRQGERSGEPSPRPDELSRAERAERSPGRRLLLEASDPAPASSKRRRDLASTPGAVVATGVPQVVR